MVRPKIHNEVTYYCQNNDGSLLIINSLEPSFIKEGFTLDEYDDDIIANIIETKPFIPIPPEEKFALSLYHTATFKYDELFDNREIMVEEMNNNEPPPNPLIELTEHLMTIENSSCKGILGEHAVERILKSKYGEERVIVTRERGHHADIMLNLPNLSISIEVKNCSSYKPDQMYKFCYDLSILHKDPKIHNLFGLIVYIQKSKVNGNNNNNRIVNPSVKKVNTNYFNSNLMAIDFLELFTPHKVVDRVFQRLSTLSRRGIDGFKFINKMADKHKLSITVGELAKLRAQEEENKKLKEELAKYQAQEEENKKLKEKLTKSEESNKQYRNTLKSILILVNTPTPF